MAALSFAAGLAVDETPGSEARSAIEPRLVLDFITTVIGQQIAYPTGTARLVAEIVTLTPTERSAWHTHDVPLFAYVLHGSIAID